MNSNDIDYEDLTVLKGIGPVRQQWLREAFNVRTYQDLAALSPKEIESQLQAEGRTASRSDIETWLMQAQELAAASRPLLTYADPVTEESSQDKPRPSSKAEEWRPFASFAVEFQTYTDPGQPEVYRTRVHHMETDTDAMWSGIEREQLCMWMLQELGDRVELSSLERSIIAAEPATVTQIQVTVTQVRVFQPPTVDAPTATGQANQPLQGSINRNEAFALEVVFQLSEPIATNVVQQLTYSAQFFVRGHPIHTNIHLGDTEPSALIAGQSSYTTRLSQASLEPGSYRLRALVSLHTKPPRMGYLEIPLFQVV